MRWYLRVLKKYAVFSGRARRKEFWYFFFINILVLSILWFVEIALGARSDAGYGPLSGFYALAVLLPGIGVAVRRLHDTGRTGWWVLIGFVPILGAIALLVLYALDGDPGENEYGANPKAATG